MKTCLASAMPGFICHWPESVTPTAAGLDHFIQVRPFLRFQKVFVGQLLPFGGETQHWHPQLEVSHHYPPIGAVVLPNQLFIRLQLNLELQLHGWEELVIQFLEE